MLNLVWPVSAEQNSLAIGLGFLPPAHELFAPLQADPRELQYAVRLVEPVSHKLLGEAALGDYLGLYRWALPWDQSYLQWSVGGGVFARFDMAGTSNDLETVDFYANMPIDFRQGKWSFRLMPFHTSSHLGDDYLHTTGATVVKHSWDNLKELLAYEPDEHFRFYGGYDFVIRTMPTGLARSALQGGAEWRSGWWAHQYAQTYWANDLQFWERTAWNPDYNSQLGIKVSRSPRGPRGISVFLEFGAGHLPIGQFFENRETHWIIGVKFGLS
jgi:hypothetical protein